MTNRYYACKENKNKNERSNRKKRKLIGQEQLINWLDQSGNATVKKDLPVSHLKLEKLTGSAPRLSITCSTRGPHDCFWYTHIPPRLSKRKVMHSWRPRLQKSVGMQWHGGNRVDARGAVGIKTIETSTYLQRSTHHRHRHPPIHIHDQGSESIIPRLESPKNTECFRQKKRIKYNRSLWGCSRQYYIFTPEIEKKYEKRIKKAFAADSYSQSCRPILPNQKSTKQLPLKLRIEKNKRSLQASRVMGVYTRALGTSRGEAAAAIFHVLLTLVRSLALIGQSTFGFSFPTAHPYTLPSYGTPWMEGSKRGTKLLSPLRL